jgi:hypothetical protein
MVDLNVLKARHGLVTVSKSDVYWEDLQDENRAKCSVPGRKTRVVDTTE